LSLTSCFMSTTTEFILLSIGFLFHKSDSIHIIDNGIDTRLIAGDNPTCNSGRIEFFNGSQWGSFSDCSQSMTMDIASSFCQSLGWNLALSFNLASNHPNQPATNPEFITYTNIHCPLSTNQHHNSSHHESSDVLIDHNDSTLADICVDCQFTNQIADQCPENSSVSDIHSKYDVYITCSNQCDGNSNANLSQLFECVDYVVNDTADIYDDEQWGSKYFGSCSDAFAGDDDFEEDEMWKMVVMAVSFVIILLAVAAFVKYHGKGHVKHRRFTDAYLKDLEEDGDIRMGLVKESPNDEYRPFDANR